VASAGDDGVIRAAQVDLDCDEIKHHLESGRVCASLALTKTDQLSFTLQDDLSLKKLAFDTALLETVEDADDQEAQFDADAHLQAPLLFEVIEQLVAILGGEVLPVACESTSSGPGEAHQDAA
ncbi:MAG: recombination-associated protein RdgC, partial [Billgrantia desiderata]